MRFLLSRGDRFPNQRAKSKRATRPSSTAGRPLRLESLERRQLLAAEVLQITVENLSENGGLAQTPFWVAVHDGNFRTAESGVSAIGFGGLELIAEEGDTSELVARFATSGIGNDAVITAPSGFSGAPVFEPGEVVTRNLTVTDTLQSPFFSYASMIIPSNDAFIANLNPQAIRLFDTAGNFIGPRTITIFGSQIWDAGTEVNNPNGGPAFATTGGASIDEAGVVHLLSGLDEFVGIGLPTGGTLAKAFGPNTPIARITISTAAAPSNPIDLDGPRVALVSSDLNNRAPFHEVTVVYSDPSGVDIGSIGPSNLRITGPILTQLNVLSVVTDATSGTTPNEVTATYRVAPAAGDFTSLDNGTYSVVLLDNQVNDTLGQAATSQNLGEFTVNAPVRLNVTFENVADIGGFASTPVWIGAHDGNFEVARAGLPASNFGGLEDIAEEGIVDELVNRFGVESNGNGAVIFAPAGFSGAPVFEPGEAVTQILDVTNPLSNRFFSYASMVIPSNDAFIANLNPRAIELFDRFGNFTGTRTFTLYGHDIWDSGTEVNDPNGAAAFSTEGGVSTDENGVIHRHTGLDDFIGTGVPTGGTITSRIRSTTPIARLTISMGDVPSNPIDADEPRVTLDATSLTGTSAATHTIHVTYSDPSGVDVSTIGADDIRVVDGFGGELTVVVVTTDAAPGTTANNVTATYQLARSDGRPFSNLDNGLYSVTLNNRAASDSLGNETTQRSLGSFEVLLAVQLRITVENLSPIGGLAATPLWFAVHEGNFEVARGGVSAANFGGLEDLAEEGIVSGLADRFRLESDGVSGAVTAPGGFPAAPVIEPGEVASQSVSIFSTNVNRFFSFASMLIPSNDAFFANFNPRQFELFDEAGFFLGQQSITLTGRDVYDAGTEVNLVGGGAAFSAAGGTGTDENGIIRRLSGLDEFIGSGLPTGTTLLSAYNSQTPLLRITIGLADASSLPIDQDGPTASLDAEPVTVAGATDHTIQVTYNDPSGVDLTTIGTDDLIVTGPLGRALNVIDAVADAPSGTTPHSVTVTYTLATADSQFTARNNGRYDVRVANDAVRDTLGQGISQVATGNFAVDVGVRLKVDVQSLTDATGLSQTPFWVGFHDGSFEVARGGVSASQFGGLELIAEEGDASELIARFIAESDGTGALLTAPGGFAGAPVIEPGELASQIVEVSDSRTNRFFSFASMVIPSNDAFVASLNSRRYELFDSLGNFHGARQITIFGRDILDAGTEVDDPALGAAFSTEGGVSVDENNVIRKHAGLDNFIGTGLPTGQNLGRAFDDLTPIATITISLFDPEADVCSGVDGACSAQSVSLQNSRNSADVNDDGAVSALDALLVINFLNRFGNQSTITDEAQAFGLDLDVGGDQNISASDALEVINQIRLETEAQRSAESASTSRSVSLLDFAFSELGREDDDENESNASSLLAQLF